MDPGQHSTIARCIHVLAEAGVADAVGDQPRSVAELAAPTDLDAGALGRMLRLVSAHGVFACGPQGVGHTPASMLLRSDHSQSLRSFARMIGMPVIWRGFTDLEHAARTGTPATDSAALFAYFADHPNEADVFNRAMAGKSAGVVPTVVDACDFSPFRTVADIGGGRAFAESDPGACADCIRHPLRSSARDRRCFKHWIELRRAPAAGWSLAPPSGSA